jgi:hypothetical protein
MWGYPVFRVPIAYKKARGLPINAPNIFYYFQYALHHVQKGKGSICMRSKFIILLIKFSKVLQLSRYHHQWFGSTLNLMSASPSIHRNTIE